MGGGGGGCCHSSWHVTQFSRLQRQQGKQQQVFCPLLVIKSNYSRRGREKCHHHLFSEGVEEDSQSIQVNIDQ